MKIKQTPSVPVWMAAILLAAAVPASATTASFQPGEDTSKDTFVYSYLTSWNFDTDSTGSGSVYGDLLSAGNTGGTHDTQTLVQFNVSSLGSATTISSATLYLYVVSSSAAGFGESPSATYPITLDIYSNTSSWLETGATWSSKPSVAGSIADSVSVNGIGYWIAFDVKDEVQSHISTSGSSNYGFTVKQNAAVYGFAGNVIAVFNSSTQTAAPVLEVVY